MKLEQRETEPEVRSFLSFTDQEAIEALTKYASTKGYCFGTGGELDICWPDLRIAAGMRDPVSLSVTIKGTVPGIIKGA